MDFFKNHVDELVALIMAIAGVIVLLAGSYALFFLELSIAVEDILLISTALLSSSTAYLFGKSVPQK